MAEVTIRERILKVLSSKIDRTQPLGGRGNDPREDTESFSKTAGYPERISRGRGNDPREDTERIIQEEIAEELGSGRGNDPREDTESAGC